MPDITAELFPAACLQGDWGRGPEPSPQRRAAVVGALLAVGADWRAADSSGSTPLMLAAQHGAGAAAAALLCAARRAGDCTYVDATSRCGMAAKLLLKNLSA